MTARSKQSVEFDSSKHFDEDESMLAGGNCVRAARS